jgi:hypothetical protein
MGAQSRFSTKDGLPRAVIHRLSPTVDIHPGSAYDFAAG